MEALKKNKNKIIKLKQAKKIIIFLVFVLFFEFLLFPAPSLASQMEVGLYIENQANGGIISDSQAEINQEMINVMEFNGRLPQSPQTNIEWSDSFVITAYNSEAGQTDGSPCVTANNFNVCRHGVEDTIAANFLPFGTKVKIPALFGDRIFVVRDRMNKRYSDRVDVWMIEKPDALKFGVRIAKIEVLE